MHDESKEVKIRFILRNKVLGTSVITSSSFQAANSKLRSTPLLAGLKETKRKALEGFPSWKTDVRSLIAFFLKENNEAWGNLPRWLEDWDLPPSPPIIDGTVLQDCKKAKWDANVENAGDLAMTLSTPPEEQSFLAQSKPNRRFIGRSPDALNREQTAEVQKQAITSQGTCARKDDFECGLQQIDDTPASIHSSSTLIVQQCQPQEKTLHGKLEADSPESVNNSTTNQGANSPASLHSTLIEACIDKQPQIQSRTPGFSEVCNSPCSPSTREQGVVDETPCASGRVSEVPFDTILPFSSLVQQDIGTLAQSFTNIFLLDMRCVSHNQINRHELQQSAIFSKARDLKHDGDKIIICEGCSILAVFKYVMSAALFIQYSEESFRERSGLLPGVILMLNVAHKGGNGIQRQTWASRAVTVLADRLRTIIRLRLVSLQQQGAMAALRSVQNDIRRGQPIPDSQRELILLHASNVAEIMRALQRLPSSYQALLDSEEARTNPLAATALIHLGELGLSKGVYDCYKVATLTSQAVAALEKLDQQSQGL